ncbi:TetR/AcrR family transcriptional regulator [Clostridium sardiniense]|uniref:TetR/AcrR family transcriptional regulator n=1 Tax=Clostridium sardiniense TaxID=29369 RepID=A0ABS7KYR5_CLOSR|nr:TetR/AcrR family transcriptional regulator [Clostridium sardiniense]MBM7836193.1 AcrR family transcriptional regulator [Clostridium sardiniense]MBY0755672.1 TetR/AcrR family transcriptional regulator [Clostridium sardiniense]MDQ0462160.1 AcrR family transcriptional regulator [Clostridium sardiniense]
MPKIIKNLDEKIFNVAWQLFTDSGYDNVDIKAIAKECDVAVGTLYNYYGNKRDLFLKVLEKSWNNTFDKLKRELIKEEINELKTIKFINVLYADIKERKGLGTEILNQNKIIKETILIRLYEFVNELDLQDFKRTTKKEVINLIKLLLYNIVFLINVREDNDEANIEFLISILKIF